MARITKKEDLQKLIGRYFKMFKRVSETSSWCEFVFVTGLEETKLSNGVTEYDIVGKSATTFQNGKELSIITDDDDFSPCFLWDHFDNFSNFDFDLVTEITKEEFEEVKNVYNILNNSLK